MIMKMSDYDVFERIFISVVASVVGFVVFCSVGSMTGCNESYSEGERVGIVTKLSRKGSLNKTWEGEMNLGGMVANDEGHMQTNIWEFTVPEEDTQSLKIIQEAQRSQKAVVIRYKGWLIRRAYVTDSGYMVQGVEYVRAEKAAIK
jgi:hypothetical protein